jgi:hypothetical protein
MKITKKVWVVIILTMVLLAGCDYKKMLEKTLPKDDDAYARECIQLVKEGNYQKAIALLDPQFVDSKTENALRGIADFLNRSEIKTTEVVKLRLIFSEEKKQSVISYQLEFQDGWGVVVVRVDTFKDRKQIYGIHFEPIPKSLKEINAFTLTGKSLHYLVLIAAVFNPLFIVWAIILCIRTEMRMKWLWIVFFLFCFTKLDLNWTTGQTEFIPMSFIILGTSIVKWGLYEPWILSVGFPLGAVLFMIFRQKLKISSTQDLDGNDSNVKNEIEEANNET